MAISEPRKVTRRAAVAGAAAAVALGARSSTSAAADPVLRPALRHGLRALDVPLDGRLRRSSGGFRTAPLEARSFSMFGLTWTGGEPRLRVRFRIDGRWGGWTDQRQIADLPDRGSEEGDGSAVGTDLLWVRGADAVQVESSGPPPRGLTMVLMDPGRDWVSALPFARPAGGRRRTLRPDMRSRKAWGADESLRSGSPRYNRTIQQVHVHHTVNGNGYSRAEVPGIIRGIYRYHTKNLGWSDIGYNFLVDRFGRIWVGRAGGPHRPVRGAHTLGFNSTSTGVALIGNSDSRRQDKVVETAIVRLAAWKLHKYGRNPKGTVKVYSHGSDRFPAGRTVRLPVIDGHRDTNETACPGRHLYARLPNIRRRAADRIRRFTT
jgi:hypothetical protein